MNKNDVIIKKMLKLCMILSAMHNNTCESITEIKCGAYLADSA